MEGSNEDDVSAERPDVPEVTGSDLASFDVAIHAARARVRRAEHLEAMASLIASQIASVEADVVRLEAETAAEEADVAALERKSFTSLVARLARNKDERLLRERAEAEAARAQLTGERERLESLREELAAVETKRSSLGDSAQAYEDALAAKESVLQGSGGPVAAELTRLARTTADVESLLRERDEALAAATGARKAVATVLKFLGDAQKFATWDRLGAEGHGDSLEMHSMRRAEDSVWVAQRALDVLSAELADVGERVAPKLPKLDSWWFADVFYGNFITDAVRHQRIVETEAAIQRTAGWIRTIRDRLTKECATLASRRQALVERRHAILDGETRPAP